MKLALMLCVFASTAFASERSLKAMNENLTVQLAQFAGKENLYYVKVDKLGVSEDGEILVLNRTLSRNSGEEEFSNEGLPFRIRLGGRYLREYTKPPTAGILLHGGRDINLTSTGETHTLAEDYKKQTCDGFSKEAVTEKLNAALEAFNKACQSKAKLSLSWGKEPASLCQGASFIQGATDLCGDADYKSVLAKTTEFKIAEGKTEFAKNGSALSIGTNSSAVNTHSRTRNWLSENL